MSQHGCPERLSNRSKGFQEDGTSQPTMELLVETLTGTAFEMTVSPSDTIFAIKSKIFRVEGIPVSQQHLVYKLKELSDASSLRELGIADGARLRLVLGMCGGPVATRRLPPPPGAEPWREIERLLDSNRDEGTCPSGSCKVTVLLFREGERVNMLRVRKNRDGTYSPLEHTKCITANEQAQMPEQEVEDISRRPWSFHENAVTMSKMLDLRRRMENLYLQRRHKTGIKPEIQKTRSEETLSVPSLLDDPSSDPFKSYPVYSEAEDTFEPLFHGSYRRFRDCSFNDRFSLLPPIGTRTSSAQSVQEAGDRERLSGLTGSILVKGEDEAAILEECLDGVEECRDSTQLTAKNLAPIPATEYGCAPTRVVGGAVCWRARGAGGGGAGGAGGAGGGGGAGLARLPLPPLPPLHHSASALHVLAPRRHAPLSASTSDLRQARILPALSRHRNREHLHLSDEGLSRAVAPPACSGPIDPAPGPIGPAPGPIGPRAPPAPLAPVVHCNPLGPVGSPSILGPGPAPKDKLAPVTVEDTVVQAAEITTEKPVRKPRMRCLVCRRRLSIATEHTCRCGGRYCAPHRYGEAHACRLLPSPSPAVHTMRDPLP